MSDLFSLAGKTALVTGATHGIGAMIARGFIEAGVRVYVTARDKTECDVMAAELSKLGECVAIPADLSREEECVRLAREIKEREDRLHILVNNAGTGWSAPLEQFPAEGWDKVLDLNLKAPFYLTRELASRLKESGTPEDPARIVNIGSVDALRVAEFPTYSASTSKAAVHHLTRILAADFAPNVTVNAIAPGSFPSRMMAEVLQQFRPVIEAVTPLKRIGRAADVVGTAVFLCSTAGSYLTGTVIPVDGGLSTCRLGFVPPQFLPAA